MQLDPATRGGEIGHIVGDMLAAGAARHLPGGRYARLAPLRGTPRTGRTPGPRCTDSGPVGPWHWHQRALCAAAPQPYWRDRYQLRPEQFPVADMAYQRMFSIPLFTAMSDADQERIITALHTILG